MVSVLRGRALATPQDASHQNLLFQNLVFEDADSPFQKHHSFRV